MSLSNGVNESEENILSEDDAVELEKFNVAIEKVTNFVHDQNADEKQLAPTTSLALNSPSIDSSIEPSVSYSEISDDGFYVHGAAFSSPKARFTDSAIPDVISIHDLLATRDQTLYFIAESDQSDDQTLNDEELSEERRMNELKLSRIDSIRKSIKKKRKKRQNKLQRSLSERGLTFAISEGHVYFSWGVFFREFFYNFFSIFVLPIILYFENKTGAQSRQYWPCDWRLYAIFGFVQFLGFFYVNGMWIYWNIAFGGEVTLGYSLVLLVYNLLYIGRITIIAIKWAYLPPQIFPLMRKKQLTQAQFNMIHLLTGWVAANNKTGLAREIGQCCARLELDISSLKFSFRDEYTQRLKSTNLSLRRRCSTYTTYGNLLIPYVVFCASKHIGARSKYYIIISRVGSPIICAGPFITRLLTWWNTDAVTNGESTVNDDWDWTQTALAIPWNLLAYVTTVSNLSTLILFCSVIALDFQRRYGLVRFSTRLMQPNKDAFLGFVNYDDYKSHLFPKCASDKEKKKILDSAIIQTLDLSDAETVYNWSLLRAFFLDFGLRFLRREEAILGFFCLAIFFIIAFYLTMIYTNVLKPTALEAAFVVFSSISVLFPAGNALKYATKINQKVQDQKAILADKRLKLENEKSSVDAQTIKEQKHVDDMIHRGSEVEVNAHYVSQQIESTVDSIGRASCMMEKIMNMLEVDRFRIRLLGYPIDTTVTGIIAGVVGTIGFLVARLVLGEDVEGIPDTR